MTRKLTERELSYKKQARAKIRAELAERRAEQQKEQRAIERRDIEKTLFANAVKAYANHIKRTGAIYQEPSWDDSTIGSKYVTLRNINGILAKYDIHAGQIV